MEEKTPQAQQESAIPPPAGTPPPPPWRRPWPWLLLLGTAGLLAVGFLLLQRPIAAWWAERALPRGRQPSVLLVTLDSVRADRLPPAADRKIETPRLDALAREGVVFTHAYAQTPLGVPSQATILTGLLPAHHGIRDDVGDVLRKEAPTLAEAFRRAGYRTGAFVSSSDLDQRAGLARGFDLYQDDFGAAGKSAAPGGSSPAPETVFRALSWLGDDARPVFLWVHLADAVLPTPQQLPASLAKAYRERPYDGAIASMDQEIGRLLDGMRTARPETLVAVLADHGEALGDHGEPRHGLFVYEATTRIPFILWMPGHVPAARNIGAIVRAMDLAPTLLDACGLPPLARADGRSLVPLIVGKTSDSPGSAPIENGSVTAKYGFGPLAALRSGPYRYVRAPRPELYDVAQDPTEKDDATKRLPDVAQRLEQELAAIVPDSPERKTLPDAKDNLDLFGRYVLADRFAAANRLAQAEVAYRSIVAEAPGFALARRRLGEVLLRERRPVEAAVVFRELVAEKRADETVYLNLALCEFQQKRAVPALEVLKQGAQAHPDSAPLHHRSGRLLLDLKRYDDAARELRRALELEPKITDAQIALGQALEAAGRREEARAAFTRVCEVAPLAQECKDAKAALERLKTSL